MIESEPLQYGEVKPKDYLPGAESLKEKEEGAQGILRMFDVSEAHDKRYWGFAWLLKGAYYVSLYLHSSPLLQEPTTATAIKLFHEINPF